MCVCVCVCIYLLFPLSKQLAKNENRKYYLKKPLRQHAAKMQDDFFFSLRTIETRQSPRQYFIIVESGLSKGG